MRKPDVLRHAIQPQQKMAIIQGTTRKVAKVQFVNLQCYSSSKLVQQQRVDILRFATLQLWDIRNSCIIYSVDIDLDVL